jgi:hypothetical protein
MSGFVVKATSPDGGLTWISPPALGCFPILGSREVADVFETRLEAYAAICLLPEILGTSGVQFSVEQADDLQS